MCGFLLRIVINAVLVFFVMNELPGLFIDTLGGTLLAVVIIGLANAMLRPLITASPLNFNSITLGSMTLLTNIIILIMIVKILPGFQVAGLFAPLAGICLVSACSFTVSKVIRDR